ncbi:DUF4148 domain-containing protein [Paraburkholderia terrae]
MMKMLACLTLAASALAIPVLGFAQTSPAQITRAEVRADLVRVEHAGYNPARSDGADYPADIQAAEARVAAQDPTQFTNDAVGGVPFSGTSAAGAPTHATAPSSCVGPVSFCKLYFGS